MADEIQQKESDDAHVVAPLHIGASSSGGVTGTTSDSTIEASAPRDVEFSTQDPTLGVSSSGEVTGAISAEHICDDPLQLFVNQQTCLPIIGEGCRGLCRSLRARGVSSCIFGPRQFDEQSPDDLREMCPAGIPMAHLSTQLVFLCLSLTVYSQTVGCDTRSWPDACHRTARSSPPTKCAVSDRSTRTRA